MSAKNIVIIISGPTASGKTSCSLKLSQKLNENQIDAAIVNFDSLLFYRELNIGTAKPTAKELKCCEHHLIDITSAKTPINASDYVTLAKNKINELHRLGKVVILVGGSGFYLRALIKGMYESGPKDPQIEKKVQQIYKNDGIEPLRKVLEKNDLESFTNLHENDHYRIQRAVEFFWATGKTISNEKKKMDSLDPYDFTTHENWNLFHCYLDLPKEEHYKIIENRTKTMFDDGLLDEVKNLLSTGFTGEEKPLQSIGYKETVSFIQGGFNSIEECMERISISTRQLAKSQRTWFNKVKGKGQYSPFDENLYSDVLEFINAQPSQ